MEISFVEKSYTVAEFVQMEDLDENAYYELINGEIVKRSAPHPQHQKIVVTLTVAFGNHVAEKKSGELYVAPIDVFLDSKNAYQPDMLFVSNEKKAIITDNGVEGVPDLVVEILSPSTAKYDRGEKMKVYRKHQVREYWLIDPKLKSVEVYVFRNGDYDLDFLETEKGTVQSTVLPGFSLSVETIFN